MRASSVVDLLRALIEKHGDLEVFSTTQRSDDLNEITTVFGSYNYDDEKISHFEVLA